LEGAGQRLKCPTETVGYHNVIDVYQDTMFKTYAFVARHNRLTREQALIAGLLTDPTRTPLPHRKVSVTLPSGEIRTVFTNAQGIYRAFDVPDGEHEVTVGDVTTEVQVERRSGEPALAPGCQAVRDRRVALRSPVSPTPHDRCGRFAAAVTGDHATLARGRLATALPPAGLSPAAPRWTAPASPGAL
jgi:hypothetical protein